MNSHGDDGTNESTASATHEAALERRLGLFDAVTVGAGSMIGAGVFSAWGPPPMPRELG